MSKPSLSEALRGWARVDSQLAGAANKWADEAAALERQLAHFTRHCEGAPSKLSEMLTTAAEEGYSSNEWVDYWIPAAIALENNQRTERDVENERLRAAFEALVASSICRHDGSVKYGPEFEDGVPVNAAYVLCEMQDAMKGNDNE